MAPAAGEGRVRSRNSEPRRSAVTLFVVLVGSIGLMGCAHRRYGHLLADNDIDMVGSHAAGAATWNPLVDQAVAQLLSRCPPPVRPVGFESDPSFPAELLPGSELVPGVELATGPATVCFIALENKSAEELGDFKDQIFERIDGQINQAETFRGISRRMVDAALRETRLRPDALFLPQNRELFAAALGRQGAPVDFLLYGTITSGTTDRNKSTQRDYLLTLEMVNVHSGDFVKESAKIRKGYHNSRAGKWWNYGPFGQADG